MRRTSSAASIQSLELGDGLTGAHHRDAVADLVDLVHPVGDEDDADALSREAADHREQPVARGDVERGGGLVEDQDLGLAQQGPDDAAGLAVRERQLLDGELEVERVPEQLLERLARPRTRFSLAGILARHVSSMPSQTLSSTERDSATRTSWNTVTIPRSWAARGS